MERLLAALAVLAVVSSGCVQSGSNGSGSEHLLGCDGFERGGVCTQQYDPVCARIEKEGSVEWRTFPNACVACTSEADGNVTGYVPGECEGCSGEGEFAGRKEGCCPGLVAIGCEASDKSGECLECGSGFVCTRCGDGVCGPGENKCNCVDCQ